MSKRKKRRIAEPAPIKASTSTRKRKPIWIAATIGVALLLAIGVFAENEWFPSSKSRTVWFGRPLVKNASNSWNPLAAPLQNPTPQLSKEYVYASGARLLSVVDANAQEAPPADLAIWRPSTGGWWVMGGQWSQSETATWGTCPSTPECDDPVEGDYDGDGKTDFAVYRPSNNGWYIVYSSNGITAQFAFGSSGDVPAQADFDGDGKTDATVFRPSTGVW